MNPQLPDEHAEAFRRTMAHRTMLAAYVRAIVHDRDLAEDVVADVSVEIVRSWNRYDPSRPFPPWARGVARRVALASLRKLHRQPALLDAGVLEAIGSAIDAYGDEARLAERKRVLAQCVEKLPARDRKLVRLRYFDNKPHADIAQIVKRTVGALYTAFSRIHKALRDCVRRHLETA